MEPLAFQFQDDAHKNALIFEEFDNIAGSHSGQNVTKFPQKSRKAGRAGLRSTVAGLRLLNNLLRPLSLHCCRFGIKSL
jgi:hypothetical protein